MRRPQFSLKTMLVMTTIAAVSLFAGMVIQRWIDDYRYAENLEPIKLP